MLQEAEEPQDLRTIGIDPTAFMSEVHMERTLKQLPVVICMAIAMASISKAKQHACVENNMHMPECSCNSCLCLS